MSEKEFKDLKNKLITTFALIVVIFQLAFGLVFIVLDDITSMNTIYLLTIEVLLSILIVLLVAKYFIKYTLRFVSESDKAKKEFVSNAAHELKTPLTIIQSDIELALKAKDFKKHLNNALKDVKETSVLINNLLQLTTLKKNSTLDTLNFIELVDEVIETNQNKLSAKNLSVNKVINDKRIFGDEVLTIILLHNLIDNAIKYSPENSTIVIQKEKNDFTITNKTILDPDIKKVQRRFYSKTKVTTGHGIGLSIVKRIADISNWKLRFKKENGYFKAIITFN